MTEAILQNFPCNWNALNNFKNKIIPTFNLYLGIQQTSLSMMTSIHPANVLLGLRYVHLIASILHQKKDRWLPMLNILKKNYNALYQQWFITDALSTLDFFWWHHDGSYFKECLSVVAENTGWLLQETIWRIWVWDQESTG